MNVGLYHTVAAMRTNQQRVEIITSNIANSESAGFKRMLHVAHGRSGWGCDAGLVNDNFVGEGVHENLPPYACNLGHNTVRV